MQIEPSIFKAYDIRGIVGKTLTPEVARFIGLSFGSAAAEQGESRGGRPRRPPVRARSAGRARRRPARRRARRDRPRHGRHADGLLRHQYRAGRPPRPSGIMVTGSHNPPDYNGFKMVLGGKAIYGEQIQALRQRIEAGNFAKGAGGYKLVDVRQQYLDRIVGDVKLARPMKIALDAGNGVAGAFVGDLFRALGCEVVELFCDVDGHFPNHHPDPAHVENLQDLIQCLRDTDCELGLAFDGDGDRLGVVTKDGRSSSRTGN
jgi:phosphomannomutase/phosphoglucomutase